MTIRLNDFIFSGFTEFPGHWKDGKLYSAMIRFGHLGVSYNTNHVTAEEAMSYQCFWENQNWQEKSGILIGTCQALA